MPWLAALGRRSYDRAAGRRGSDRGSDGGGGSAVGGEVRECGLGLGWDRTEGEEGGMF